MLSTDQLNYCLHTISPNAFFLMVLHSMERKWGLSVVRAADGERKLLEHCRNFPPETQLFPFGGLTTEWFKKYGIDGITTGELKRRIEDAVTMCTYFAPSISGIRLPHYNTYYMAPTRLYYVDNFFPNLWSEEQKVELFQKAGRVTFVHGDRKLADAMQKRAKEYYGVAVSYLPLTCWQESEDVIAKANKIASPLTIFSGGPASKYIGPRITGVTLDIGAAAYRWSFLPEYERRKKDAVQG